MKVVPFKKEHLDGLLVQPAQKHVQEWVKTVNYGVLEGPSAYSVFENGECLGCGGLTEVWPGRAQIWSILSAGAGKHLTAITKITKRVLNISPWRRIEATVDCDFEQGHRWVRILGFTLEAERMTAYMPDGKDVALYARIRHG